MQQQPQLQPMQHWPGSAAPVGVTGPAVDMSAMPSGSLPPISSSTALGKLAPHLQAVGSRVASPGVGGLTYMLPQQNAQFHFSSSMLGSVGVPSTDDMLAAFMPGCDLEFGGRSSVGIGGGSSFGGGNNSDGSGGLAVPMVLSPFHAVSGPPTAMAHAASLSSGLNVFDPSAMLLGSTLPGFPDAVDLSAASAMGCNPVPAPQQQQRHAQQQQQQTSEGSVGQQPAVQSQMLPQQQQHAVAAPWGTQLAQQPFLMQQPQQPGAQVSGQQPWPMQPHGFVPPMQMASMPGAIPGAMPGAVASLPVSSGGQQQQRQQQQQQQQEAMGMPSMPAMRLEAWQHLVAMQQMQAMAAAAGQRPQLQPMTSAAIAATSSGDPQQPQPPPQQQQPQQQPQMTAPSHMPQPTGMPMQVQLPQPGHQQMAFQMQLQAQAALMMQQQFAAAGQQMPYPMMMPAFPYGPYLPQHLPQVPAQMWPHMLQQQVQQGASAAAAQPQQPQQMQQQAQQQQAGAQSAMQVCAPQQPQPGPTAAGQSSLMSATSHLQQTGGSNLPLNGSGGPLLGKLSDANLATIKWEYGNGQAPTSQTGANGDSSLGAKSMDYSAGVVPDMSALQRGTTGSVPQLPPSAQLANHIMQPPQLPAPAFATKTRAERVERYREKKARRTDGATVRYHARQLNAHRRPRIKGRFVKANELANHNEADSAPSGELKEGQIKKVATGTDTNTAAPSGDNTTVAVSAPVLPTGKAQRAAERQESVLQSIGGQTAATA